MEQLEALVPASGGQVFETSRVGMSPRGKKHRRRGDRESLSQSPAPSGFSGPRKL